MPDLTITTDARELRGVLAPYQRPSHLRSAFEILTTALPLAVFWGLALVAVSQGIWWGVLLTIPAALFLVRMFMIQHDCGHGSFFRERAANEWVGRIIGVLTLTPYDYWRRTHAIHHATSGNLDRRGLGAVETMTVEEFRAKSPVGRLAYRFYRHPLVMLGLGPAYLFVLQQRLPIGMMKDKDAWFSAIGNSMGAVLLVLVELSLFGWQGLVMVHLPIVIIAGSTGVWLFYMQHQFEGAHWVRNDEWTLHETALRGSSHLDLPAPLRWLTANIGAHHLHHAGSKIPFYRLPQVMNDHPEFKPMSRITLKDSPQAMRLSLWDEAKGRLVTFAEARREMATA